MAESTQRTICYVTDRRSLALPGGLGEGVRRAMAAGVDWVQIREKDLSTRALVAAVRNAVTAVAGSNTRVLVNDRLDVAVTESAGGVHLGGESIPVDAVKRWCSINANLPAGFLLGRSCHSLEEAQDAERAGADYVFFGPVFETPAKMKFGPPQGLEKLGDVCRALRIPVLAIGGISTDNAGNCFAAGAAGIAAIRLFQQPGDIQKTLKLLRAL